MAAQQSQIFRASRKSVIVRHEKMALLSHSLSFPFSTFYDLLPENCTGFGLIICALIREETHGLGASLLSDKTVSIEDRQFAASFPDNAHHRGFGGQTAGLDHE